MTAGDIPLWTSLVGNFGFPIAITLYLFVRFEKKIERLETVIMQLSEVIKSINYKGKGE
ncbi:YvrJ family protein [Ornithinibacillus scapharcae]|uniref:YvrJ family protein n=1 Tax=Ornithinibacillus scapharcae TaxID=1147159 RepID=UPI000225B2B1|nr:YvrJ family protein [Ornithinibacillus scapharcae]